MSRNVLTYKNLAVVLAAYAALLVFFSAIARPQIRYSPKTEEATGISGVVGEVYEGITVRQKFTFEGAYIQKISLMPGTYNRKNEGKEIFSLKDSSGTVIWEKEYPASEMRNDAVLNLEVKRDISALGSEFVLEIAGSGNREGSAPTFYLGTNPAETGSIDVTDARDTGARIAGSLYLNLYGREESGNEAVFWTLAGTLAAVIAAVWLASMRKLKRGEGSLLTHFLDDMGKYGFLIRQLVVRDFKTKYKRSVLGVLWSFLNPLLTMAVQYVVFSTIFRSGIENFPVYLLSASILFNFFNEAVGNGLGSITGNASLLTKVSIPRYIYPLSGVLSSMVNLILSTIPLLLVVFITGGHVSLAYACVPFLYLALMLFCLGLGMLLATSMVYFRDTMFLWGIVSLLWMYATPIFYPETIIPDRFRFLLRCNPMYYYLKFFRTVLMENSVPDLSVIASCVIWSVAMLTVGALVFERHQKRFTLYI